jgi:hypothetical protein
MGERAVSRDHGKLQPGGTVIVAAGVPFSADADVGLHQRVDPFGQPEHRMTRPMRTPFAAIERSGAPSVGLASGAIFLN